MKKIVLTGLILLGISSITLAQNVDYTALRNTLDKIRNDWNIPGMAVGIVQGDSLVFAEGFGVKNTNTPNDKVDAQTLFPVASNSKAFTSTAMAMLVKEGKLTWDDQVKQHLPYFRLYDNYVSNNFSIADMLSHRSGLKTFSGDLIWYGSSYSREEVVKRAAHLKPEYGFRTTFGYSNIMYIAAGEIIGKASNSTWDDYMKQKIFTPLDMQHSYTSFTQIPSKANITAPHNHLGDSVFPIAFMNWDNIGAAGAIISNVEDMSQWLRFQLKSCIWEGDTMVNAMDIARMRTPHVNFTVPYRAQSPFASRHFYGYGLGWTVFDYQGAKVVGHSGGYDGIISYSCILPEKDLGIVILTNANSGLYNAVLYTLLDTYLNPGSTVNWSELMLPGEQHGRVKKSLTPPETPIDYEGKIEQYLGRYESKIYGTVKVYKEKGELKLLMEQSEIFDGQLSHFNANQFKIRMYKLPSLPEGLVDFTIKNGKVVSLKIDIDNPDFHFDEFNFIKI